MTTYRFTQNVGYDSDGKLAEPVKYSSLYEDDADSSVTASPEMWGVPGEPDERITMDRFYAAQRTFWVDPVSGTIVKTQDHGYQYYARDALKPEVTYVDYKVTSNDETVESQVAAAQDERDRVSLWTRVLPITFTALGPAGPGRWRRGGFVRGARRVHSDRSRTRHRRSRILRHPGLPSSRCRGQDRETAGSTTVRPTTGPADLSLRSAVLPAYALALSLLITGPLLGPGYLLLRDAVSTPQSYLTDAALGLGEAAPRALPQDFLRGCHLGRARRRGGGQGLAGGRSVVGRLGSRATGLDRAADRVCRASSSRRRWPSGIRTWPSGCCRGTGACWSVTAACPGWRSACCGCAPSRVRASAWGLLFWTALAGCDADGPDAGRDGRAGVRRGPRRRLAARCRSPHSRWAPRCLPRRRGWWPRRSVEQCHPRYRRPESMRSRPGPSPAWPPSAAWPASAASGTVTRYPAHAQHFSRWSPLWCCSASSRLGLPVVIRNRCAVPLLILAAAAVLIPAAMATGPGLQFVDATIRAVPGLGVVRDGQKWVALAMPGYVLAAAAAPVTVHRLRVPVVASAAVGCAALIAVLPDLAWGVGNQMRAVQYPPGWAAAAAQINADPRPVVALPPDSMRSFYWAGSAPVLDPLPRWLRAEVLSTGDLLIGGQVMPGEGTRAHAVQDLLRSGADRQAVADAGVGWLVVETNGVPAELDLPVAYRDGDIAVYRIGGDQGASPHRALLIAAHLVWLLTLVGGAVGMAAGSRGECGDDQAGLHPGR